MTNEHSTTTSNRVKVTDVEGVEKLIDDYYFQEIVAHLNPKTSELRFTGSRSFNAFEDQFYDENVDIQFLKHLQNYLEEGEKLVIQSAGFTKIQYPIRVFQLSVSQESIILHQLGKEPRIY